MNSAKKYVISAAVVTGMLVHLASPDAVLALSCVNPEDMIQQYVESDEYRIFTAVAGEIREYDFEPANTANLNQQFADGYTGQYVTVSESHKGYVDQMMWVYYQKDSIWRYLCTNGPAEVGAKTLYIVTQNSSPTDLPIVVDSYPMSSTLAKNVVAALDNVASEGNVRQISIADWKQQLLNQIREMIFIIKIKLAELQFLGR